jgi:hypothetical protein
MIPIPRMTTLLLAALIAAVAGGGCTVQRDAYDIDVPVHIADDEAVQGGPPYYAVLYAVGTSVCENDLWSYQCGILDMATGPEPGTPRLSAWVEPVHEDCNLTLYVAGFRDDHGTGHPSGQPCHAEHLEFPYIRDEPIVADVAQYNCSDGMVDWCDFGSWDWGAP